MYFDTNLVGTLTRSAIPRDGLMKADLETGQATFVPLPEAVNDRSDLFTAEELAVFADRLTFYGYGRPGAVAIVSLSARA